MSKQAYLICLKNPFELKPFLLLKEAEGVYVFRDIQYLLSYEEIFSYGFSDLVNSFREKECKKLPEVIDLETAKKLIVGKQKDDFKSGEEPWVLGNIIGRYVTPKSLIALNNFLQLKMKASELEVVLKEVASDLMNGFKKSWTDLNVELVLNAEYLRFYEIENPIYNLFLKSQLNGIFVSKIKLRGKLDELKNLWYSHLKILELEYNFIGQKVNYEMSWETVSGYCSDKNLKDDLEYDFWKYAEIYSEYNRFLCSLVTVHNAATDYNALVRYSIDTNEKIYPQFDIMGTITGRILVTTPGIQYLKKTSRSIFEPKNGHVFLYADFDQFEPGIVASFSQDPQLLGAYNTGDVYCQLSLLLFNNIENRKLAKKIFLAFIYGMTKEKLVKFIAYIAGAEASLKGLRFFDEFKVLLEWKERVSSKAKIDGYSSSYYGNRRYIESKGALSNKEKRWVPNQIIQGTASYIFKKSLLELNKRSAKVNFLIPMHDAILVEVSSEDENEIKALINHIFNSVFREICPGIKTNISFEKCVI